MGTAGDADRARRCRRQPARSRVAARLKQLIGDREPPVETIALKRRGDPAELGRMATVLLSPVSSYVTGTALSIDGGQLKSL